MHIPLLLTATSSLLTLSLAAPQPFSASSALTARDKFDKCSTFGANCAVQDNSFCDASTGKISVCHRFGDDCWVRYTQTACGGKREAQPEPKAEAELAVEDVIERDVEVEVQKRDRFDKCTVFGATCAVNGNEFCDPETGKLSVCRRVPFSRECWVRYTQTPCAAKRQPVVEAEIEATVEKRDRFDKCTVFGAGCAQDGNTFCLDGRKSVCHKVPFSSECWVRFTAESC